MNTMWTMTYEETGKYMFDEDWRVRLLAEVKQVEERKKRLAHMLEKMRDGTLEFKPLTPFDVLMNQLEAMEDYYQCLLVQLNYLHRPEELLGIKDGGKQS